MNDLSPRAKAILHQGAAALSPSQGDEERLWRLLSASIALPPPAAAAPSEAGGPGGALGPSGAAGAAAGLGAAGGTAAAKAVKVAVLAGGLVAAALGTAVWTTTRPNPTASATPAAAPTAPEVPAIPPSPRVIEMAEAEPSPQPSATPAPTRSSPPAVTSSLAEETRLLRKAQAALASGDGTGALLALDEHAARFPRGTLASERDVTLVLAYCASGRAQQAQRLAKRIVGASRNSPYAARLRGSCAGPALEQGAKK